MNTQQTLVSNPLHELIIGNDLPVEHQQEQSIAHSESLVWLGIKLEQENKLAEAIAHYRDAVKFNSQSAVAHHILAIALEKKGNFAEANYYHRQAVSLGKNTKNQLSTNTQNNARKNTFNSNEELISQTYHSSLECTTNFKDQTNSSIQTSSKNILSKLTEIAPGSYVENNQLEIAQVYLQQAKVYYADGKWDRSLDACEKAIKICPELPEIYKLYGNCLQRLGKFAEAMGYYAKALTQDPNLAEVYANIGSLHAKQAQWKEAINYYQKALTIQPNMAKVYLHLAKAWEKIDQSEKALECLIEAIELDPTVLKPSQYLQLGESLITEGQIKLAIACYEQGAKIKPLEKILYSELIKVLEQDGQWKKAAHYHSVLINLGQENVNSQATKQRIKNLLTSHSSRTKHLLPTRSDQNKVEGSVSSIDNNYSQDKTNFSPEVRQYLDRLQQQPKSLSIRLKLAELFASQQQWQEAINYYQQAIEINPNLAIAYLKLGKIYGTLGKAILGAELIYKGFSLEPESFDARQHEQLGDFWVRHNRLKLAENCYRRAAQLKPELKTAQSKLQKVVQHQQKIDNVKSLPTNQDNSASVNTDSSIQNAETYINLGVKAEKDSNWQLALRYYYQAIDEQKGNKEAYYKVGEILKQKQQWQKVIELFQQAIKYDTQEFSYYYHLGYAYSENKQSEQAIAYFRKAIELNAQFSWSHFKMGEVFMELQQWQAAADAISNSIKHNPDFDWAHHKLGDVAIQLQYWDTAVKAYQDALKITPDLPKTEEKLTDALRSRLEADKKKLHGFYQHAIEVKPEEEASYFQALEVKSNNLEHYVKLAQIYESKEQINLAFAFYKIALQIDPKNFELQEKLSSLQVRVP